MLHMGDGLLKQLTHMIVIQVVDDLTAVPMSDNEPKVPEQAQLVRDGRRFHPDGARQLVHGTRAVIQPSKDLQPARGGKRLHRLRHRLNELRIQIRRSMLIVAVSHEQQNS